MTNELEVTAHPLKDGVVYCFGEEIKEGDCFLYTGNSNTSIHYCETIHINKEDYSRSIIKENKNLFYAGRSKNIICQIGKLNLKGIPYLMDKSETEIRLAAYGQSIMVVESEEYQNSSRVQREQALKSFIDGAHWQAAQQKEFTEEQVDYAISLARIGRYTNDGQFVFKYESDEEIKSAVRKKILIEAIDGVPVTFEKDGKRYVKRIN